ncbi:MAG TPA: Hpt domain-containing protein, partial [Coleofasciculaceae cyanobacterium]
MTINPDIRDQAYQFFSAEAPELLQIIETGLLSLSQNRNTAEVHNLMRAAHSLKGGAASVGLDAIATLSHRLENIFKALYSETLEIDTNLESQLLLAYDCLRLPLMEQITTGHLDAEEALAIADPILTQIEQYCGDALLQTESYIPSSADMGVNMLSSILEVDVVQGLKQLEAVIAHPQDYEVAGELRAQVEVFAGFAEILNLPSLGEIAEAVFQALDAHPDRALEITQLALVDFERVKQEALGDRTQTVEPSAALIALANGKSLFQEEPITATESEALAAIPLLENVFGNAFENILSSDSFSNDSFSSDSFGSDATETFATETFVTDTFADTFAEIEDENNSELIDVLVDAIAPVEVTDP